jgi:hypothetical protein
VRNTIREAPILATGQLLVFARTAAWGCAWNTAAGTQRPARRYYALNAPNYWQQQKLKPFLKNCNPK